MCSTVKPNLACSTFSGADAPKVLYPDDRPGWGRTQRSQPNVEPFSTDTRAVTDGGSTSSGFYDPPWTLPFRRRNEVAVPVARR